MEIDIFIDEPSQTTYKSHIFNIGKNRWSICLVSGKYNYVSVRKIYPNPFGVSGTQFKSIDEAQTHYKNPDLKLALLKIETGVF